MDAFFCDGMRCYTILAGAARKAVSRTAVDSQRRWSLNTTKSPKLY
jgi:hypothetical protein